jgi:hypothetical protein
MAGNKTIMAVTSNLTTLAQPPGLPRRPEQIANAVLESAKVGAQFAHIQVCHPPLSHCIGRQPLPQEGHIGTGNAVMFEQARAFSTISAADSPPSRKRRRFSACDADPRGR